MNHMPSHGNASNAKVGNAREGYMHGSMKAGHGGRVPAHHAGHNVQVQCQFPQPPPQRCYCQAAAFTSLDGREFPRLLDAYGSSIPCKSVEFVQQHYPHGM